MARSRNEVRAAAQRRYQAAHGEEITARRRANREAARAEARAEAATAGFLVPLSPPSARQYPLPWSRLPLVCGHAWLAMRGVEPPDEGELVYCHRCADWRQVGEPAA